MKEVLSSRIKSEALKFNRVGRKWHFHILTPNCGLNNQNQFALIIEGPSKSHTYVHYSAQADKDLGRELATLLHGTKVFSKTTDRSYVSSKTIKKILQRAKDLSQQKIRWHHHVLFPDCRFNQHSPKWALLFEDPQNHQTLVSLSDEEPIGDLKQIETLFYAQKKL